MSNDVVVVEVDGTSEQARQLIAHAAVELEVRYGASDGEPVTLDELTGDHGVYVCAFVDGIAIGGVGFRFVGVNLGEVKRLWIEPTWRRRGVATALMDAIEDAMVSRGCTRAILETGERQPEALAFYPARGWRRIEAYPDGVWKHPGGYAFELVLIA